MLTAMMLMGSAVMGMAATKALFLTGGQSNTDGRVPIEDLPSYITPDSYRYCHWSYGSGEHSGNGQFEQFWPRTCFEKRPQAWAYDAIVYYLLGQSLQQDFYVIKESLGGTAISTNARKSTNGMFWCASEKWLSANDAADHGGKSLIKAFTNNIDACIDQQLSKLKQGYDIKAFLWHQGESDVSMPGSYQKNLKTLIDYVRRHLVEKTGNGKYARLPVIIGSIPHASKGYSAKIETAQRNLADEDSDICFVDINDAPLLSDRLHLNAEGAELLGRKVFGQLTEIGVTAMRRQTSYRH